jgi:hypothetical protein
MNRQWKRILISITAGTLLTSSCLASENNESYVSMSQELLSLFSAASQQIAPASSAGSPVAFGSGWGSIYGGASLGNESHDSSSMDGGAAVGMGFGDPRKSVGLDASVNIISVDISDGGFAQDGSFAFSLSRFLNKTAAIAIGVDNAMPWGGAADNDTVISNQFTLPFAFNKQSETMPLTLSLGYGTGIKS